MRNIRWPALILSFLMSGMPAAFASTTVVHQMGVAPLLGVSSTTAEIREKIRSHPALMKQAAAKIGLTPREYSAFYNKFMNQKPGWVTVPRHLDAMTWGGDGYAHADYDVQIPAGTNGWEVDLYEKHQIVHVYIPMICGNISVLRTPRKAVALVRPPLPPRHIFAPIAPPAPAPVVVPPAPVLESVAQEIPPPAPAAAAVHHPHLFWPILGAAILTAVIVGSHHGGSSTPPGIPAINPPGTTGGSVAPGGGGIIAPPIVPPPAHECGCAD